VIINIQGDDPAGGHLRQHCAFPFSFADPATLGHGKNLVDSVTSAPEENGSFPPRLVRSGISQV